MRKILDATFDGMYLAASMVDYTSCCATTSLNSAHTMQQSFYQTENLPFSLLEIAIFTAFSVTAKYYQHKNKKNLFAQRLVLLWAYFRDFISGLKNGRHAIVNMSFLLQCCTQQASYQLANPVGIVVGVALGLNLVFYRKMNASRNQMIKTNNALALDIISTNQIKKHSHLQKIINYIAAGFDGLTDGMYLYGCLFLLIGLGINPITAGAPLIISIIMISVITLTSFISKLHNESLAQKELEASVLKCEINLLSNNKEKDSKNLSLLECKKEKYKALTIPTNAKNASFVSKVLFFAFRGILSGAKNANSAINSLKTIIHNWIIVAALTIIKPICAVVYAFYLGSKSICTELGKNKIIIKNKFFQMKMLQSTDKPYLRNNFI